MSQTQMRAPKVRAIIVVYGADGRPKLDPDFLDGLLPEEREKVRQDLAERGFVLDGYRVRSIEIPDA